MPDKTIVIIGASGGLGRALAGRFVADGEHVVLVGRSADKLRSLADELSGGAFTVQCDLTDPTSIRTAFERIRERHPTIDVLINCAAVFEPRPLEEVSDEQVLKTVMTNLTGPILCARNALPLLSSGGHIINVSSESVDMPFPYLTLYQSTKAGLETFGRHLDAELEQKGIKVTTVRAGQMSGDTMDFEMDENVALRFLEAAKTRGLDLIERGVTHYTSTAQLFRALVDLPADMKVGLATYQARVPGER